MYAQYHETVTLRGLEAEEGRVIHAITLRPVVVADMPQIHALAGDDPTVMDLDMARWCCQAVDQDPPLTMAMLRRLLEVDYEALNAAAERIKKKLTPTSAG